ncbi:glycerol kinase-like [Sorghum bicolor]|uniref:glycerol kinase-like n=1 Tax=Sorghum bicolor TaxID=4558 RepID=UPI000B4241B0|nr:glycerol kinase-like [Sorghum bicolor]|eukprot:XP_021313836.1 glycerol kinase-like [Sorghum bicolor]
MWSKSIGCPLYNAIVWMDARTSSVCKRLQSELSGGRTHFVETCWLPISTYFSALKLLCLMENVDAVKDAVQTGLQCEMTTEMEGSRHKHATWALQSSSSKVDKDLTVQGG